MSQILATIGDPIQSILYRVAQTQFSPSILQRLAETDAAVRPEIEKAFAQMGKQELTPLLREIMQNKRNLERAFFVRMGIEAVGGRWESHLTALAGEELLYTSMMVLDDIVDGTSRRMAKPTVHETIGTRKAISLAEILRSLADIKFAEAAKQAGLAAQAVLKIWQDNAQMVLDTYYGQYLDFEFEEIPLAEVDDRHYLHLLRYTTPVDVANCLRIGPIFAANGQESLQESLWEYGLRLGMIMQIRDDFLDFVGDEKLIDKSPFTDLVGKKKRLPIILAYRFSGRAEQARLEGLLGKPILTEEDKRFLSGVLSLPPVLSYTGALEAKLRSDALSFLRSAGLVGSAEAVLEELIQDVFIVEQH